LDLEGKNVFDTITDEKVIETVKHEINTRSGVYESTWIDPVAGEFYHEVTVYDFYEPRELIVGSAINLDEFTKPMKLIGGFTLITLAISVGIAFFIEHYLSVRIVKPVTEISDVAKKIDAGDLSSRIELEIDITKFDAVGKTFNRMIDTIQNNIEQLEEAISVFGSVLSSVASGDLKAEVDLNAVSSEY